MGKGALADDRRRKQHSNRRRIGFNMGGRVLVVDDIPDVRATLSGLLFDEGYDVCSSSSREEALQTLAAQPCDVAVVDVRLDEADEDNRDGLVLMREINERFPNTAVIILTEYADVKMVRDALQPNQEGIPPAFSFLEKTEMNELPEWVARAFEQLADDQKVRISSLIANGESSRVEFKSSLRWDFRNNKPNKGLQQVITKTVAGMLNSEGGYLLIGVDDDGEIVGIENDLSTLRKPDADGFRFLLTDLLKNYLGLEYARYISPTFTELDGKTVCLITVEESPEPVFLKSRNTHELWVRTGNSTRQLDIKAAMQYINEKWVEPE
jgi:CheY-like chemotaxis protein